MLPTTAPAGIITVNAKFATPSPVAVKSVVGAAPPESAAANVTDTSVSDANTDDDPPNRAVTTTSLVVPSTTAPGVTDNVTSASLSAIVIVCVDAPNAEEPLTVNASAGSTTASSVIVNPANVAVPDGSNIRAGKVIVFGDDGE